MQEFILTFFALALTSSASSQGYFVFTNLRADLGVNAPVFDAAGNRLSGPAYLARLYVGPTPDSLQPVVRDAGGPNPFAIQPFRTGVAAGYIVGESVRADNVSGGSVVWIQMRASEASLGGTYEEAIQARLGGYGESNLFEAQAGFTTGAGTDYTHLAGLESFSLSPVIPEPGTLSLYLLTAPVVWLAARRRLKGLNRSDWPPFVDASLTMRPSVWIDSTASSSAARFYRVRVGWE
jgi:hypothetical protein